MSGGSKLKKDRDARITKQSSFLKQRDSFFQVRSEIAGRRKDCISTHITNALHTFVVCAWHPLIQKAAGIVLLDIH